MRRYLSLLTALAASWASSSHALIFGTDDRVAVSSAPGSLFAPVGFVFDRSSGRSTTAFLISACHILTARHLVGVKSEVQGLNFEFWLNVRGDPSQWKTVRAQVAADGGVPKGGQVVSSADWMLLRLSRCLGRKFGWVRMAKSPPRVGETIALAGYPVDRRSSDGVMVARNCQVRDIRGGMLLHDCDQQPGNSGAPVFRIVKMSGKSAIELVAMAVGGHSYGVPGASLVLPVTSYHPSYAHYAVLSETLLQDKEVRLHSRND